MTFIKNKEGKEQRAQNLSQFSKWLCMVSGEENFFLLLPTSSCTISKSRSFRDILFSVMLLLEAL